MSGERIVSLINAVGCGVNVTLYLDTHDPVNLALAIVFAAVAVTWGLVAND